MKKLIFILFLINLSIIGFAGSIKHSKHNLSMAGTGKIKSTEISRICIFCHTTHSKTSYAPLWNREESKVLYTLYDSSTLYSTPGQPDGASKLCLSCHDGTIALGNVISRNLEFNMSNSSGGRIPKGLRSNLGSDISDDHPISFNSSLAVNSSLELIHPLPGDPVKYDAHGKIQCTSCHNPHDNSYSKFLVKNNRNGRVCKTCHNLTGYAGISTHDISSKTWNGMSENPWPHTGYSTVMDNSCLNCHRSHNASGKERLLSSHLEENVCLVCHNGSVGKNIKAVLVKTSSHPVRFYQGSHDPEENILSASIHSECVDCHNPHRVTGSVNQGPEINGRLVGTSGMSQTGILLNTSRYRYEICLKCHGQDKYRVTTAIRRMFDTSNIRTAISPTNASFHAIAAVGKSTWVPSLKPPYTSSSRLSCSDCHNNDSSSKAGGYGPNGPHGSNYEFILERRYVNIDYTPWSEANYELCFKCHNSASIFNDRFSRFGVHEKHIKGENTPCSICHDPHGSPGYIGLLNFDLNSVNPNKNGELKFETFGNKGYCYLECHGEEHNPKNYDRR